MRQSSPEHRSRWLPIAAYAALSAANQMLWLTFTPITTQAAEHFGVSIGAVGWLAQIFPLVYVVLALPAGRSVDRWLPQGLAIGAVLTGVGGLVRIGDTFTVVLIGQVLVAVGQPLVLNSVTKLSGSYLRAQHRASGIAVSSAGIFTGMVLALALGAGLGGDRIELLLVVQGVIAAVAAGWLCASLRLPRAHAPADIGHGSLRRVFADSYIRILTGLVLAGFGVFIALTTWLQALMEPADVPESSAGWMLLAMVIAGVVGSAALPEWVLSHRLEVGFIAVSAVVAAAGCVVLAVIPGTVSGFVVLVAIGTLVLTDLPLVLTLAERRAGSAGATATGMLWMAGNLGGLIVAVVVQVLIHRPTAAFCVLAACLIPILPLLRMLHRIQPRSPAAPTAG